MRARAGFTLPIVLGLALGGCVTERPAPAAPAVEAQAGAPAEGPAEAARHFGQPEREGLPEVALATVFADPERFRDADVQAEGEVARVCQRMGCWMELRQEGHTVRAPMAGHAFFLPRDAAGQRAVVQGKIRVRALDDATRAHLAEEGATALSSAVALEATSVRLLGP